MILELLQRALKNDNKKIMSRMILEYIAVTFEQQWSSILE